jgi:hypothetical protein
MQLIVLQLLVRRILKMNEPDNFKYNLQKNNSYLILIIGVGSCDINIKHHAGVRYCELLLSSEYQQQVLAYKTGCKDVT